MQIRPAIKEDAVFVTPLMVQAMSDLVLKFTRSSNLDTAIQVFSRFFTQENNQYSYSQTLVYEKDGKVVGSITGYDGAKLHELRKPFLSYIKKEFGFEIIPEDETESGEFYLDTVSVHFDFQGEGIGRELILAFLEKAKKLGFIRVGLLVDIQNSNARKLYERLGFQKIGEKNLLGGNYDHLIYQFDFQEENF